MSLFHSLKLWLGLKFRLRSHTLYIDWLCFDALVHTLASSKTTVDLNKVKGMLLFNSVLLELELSGGGAKILRHSYDSSTILCSS